MMVNRFKDKLNFWRWKLLIFFTNFYICCITSTLWEISDLQNMISRDVSSYWVLAMLPECSAFRQRHPKCMLQHAEEECKDGFHFLETDPSNSFPSAEWLFIVGFVLLIAFFGFMFLRRVPYILRKSPSFRSFLKEDPVLLKSLLETIILCLLTDTALNSGKIPYTMLCSFPPFLRRCYSRTEKIPSLVLCWVLKIAKISI